MSHLYDYHATIPWHVLKAHLEDLQRKTDSQMRRSRGDDTLIAQGKSLQIESFLNLPETLDAQDLADLEAEKEVKHGQQGNDGKRAA